MSLDDYSSESDEFLKKYISQKFKHNLGYTEYNNEKELISLTKEKTMLVHFFTPEFEKCKLLNRALRELSPKFPSVDFCSINVDKSPKMCECLGITTLPFVGFFRDGLFVDKLIGFEELGNRETFKKEDLENFIKNSYLFKDE